MIKKIRTMKELEKHIGDCMDVTFKELIYDVERIPDIVDDTITIFSKLTMLKTIYRVFMPLDYHNYNKIKKIYKSLLATANEGVTTVSLNHKLAKLLTCVDLLDDIRTELKWGCGNLLLTDVNDSMRTMHFKFKEHVNCLPLNFHLFTILATSEDENLEHEFNHLDVKKLTPEEINKVKVYLSEFKTELSLSIDEFPSEYTYLLKDLLKYLPNIIDESLTEGIPLIVKFSKILETINLANFKCGKVVYNYIRFNTFICLNKK